MSIEINVRCPYCDYESVEQVDALAGENKQPQRIQVSCKACGQQFTIEAKASVRLRILSKDTPPRRTLNNTIRNERWLQAVSKLALLGVPAAEIREQLIENGFPAPCEKTIKGYISQKIIPGVTEDTYLAAVEKTERERKKEDAPEKKEWRRVTTDLLLAGWELEEICVELRRKELRPASKTSIRNRIESQYFPGITMATYKRAVKNRRKRKKRQWNITVRTMMEQGQPLSKIRAKLVQMRLSPNCLGSLSAALQSGKIPGVTPESYQEAQEVRKTTQTTRWAQVVGEMLDAKASLPDIQERLQKENLSPHGAKAIVQLIKSGAVPGHKWEAPGSNEWAALVYDLMECGMTLKAIQASLQENGVTPYSRTTVAERLREGQIKKELGDGMWSVMTAERYAEQAKKLRKAAKQTKEESE